MKSAIQSKNKYLQNESQGHKKQQSFSQIPDDQFSREQHSVLVPENFKKTLLAKMNKLSNKGWSYHLRLIKMDQHALAYYRNVPKDYDENNHYCPSVENGTLKPKASIPLKKILSVSEITEEDKKKFKKLSKAPDVAFKIVFSKKHLVKKEYQPGQDESDDGGAPENGEEQDDERGRNAANGSAGQKSRSKSKGASKKDSGAITLDSWYLVCDTKKEQEFWIDQLVLSGQQLNPMFDIDDDLEQKVAQRTQRLANNLNSSRQNMTKAAAMLYEDQDNEEDDDFETSAARHKKKGAQQSSQQFGSSRRDPSDSRSKGNSGLNKSKDRSAQQIPLFKGGKGAIPTGSKASGVPGHSRSDSNYSDLNQVLQQNLNINNVQLDDNGNVGDQDRARVGGMNDDDDGDLAFDQEAKERVRKVLRQVEKYQQASLNLHDRRKDKEKKGWDMKFQNYWGYLVAADKNLRDSMTLSEKFFDHIGLFRRTCHQLVKEIVDDLHKPHESMTLPREEKRKHMPVKQIAQNHQIFLDDEDQILGQNSRTMFYYIQNIIIKITYQGEQVMDQNPFTQNQTQIVSTGNRTNMQNANSSGIDQSYMTGGPSQNKNPDPFQHMKWKYYGREFLSMDIIFDTLYLLSKPDSLHKLRVPLSSRVDYKGFRAVCIAGMPIQPQLGPSLGFYTDGKYVPYDMKLKQELAYVGDILNLKENRINQKGQGAQFESVPVSFFIKLYNYIKPESNSDGEDPDTPTKKSKEFHFTDLDYLEEPYYVLKTAEIFPYDCDQSEHPKKDRFLRPEFVCTYERPLKADARKDISIHVSQDTKSKDDENDQVDLNEATRFLRSTVIPNLVNLLDSLIIMPIDSESLELTFHSQGVNMRYLGMVASLSIVPHVKDICINEMIARACKNILNKQLSAMILDHQKRYVDAEERRDALSKQQLNRNQPSSSTLQGSSNMMKRQNQMNQQSLQEHEQKMREISEELEELRRPMDDTVRMAVIDYMNLVFGAGDETTDFWNTVLLPLASSYFGYPFDDIQRAPKYLNALFFAFTKQVGIKFVKPLQNTTKDGGQTGRMDQRQQQQQQFKDDDYFKEFGKSEIPFGQPDRAYIRIQIVGKSKSFGLRNLSYHLLAEKYREFRTEGRIENALQCCKMKRIMKRLLDQGADDVSTIADICEIALDNGEFTIAKEQAIEGLKHVQSPMHAEAIKFYCILMRAFYGMDFAQEADQYFSKALATLDHHWGPFHPLHSTIYGIMAHLLIQKGKMDEAKYLYESSLICSLRVLGPNHIQTAEIHIDFGRLYLRMKNKDESLQHFEEAYLIYESYFGQNALPTANAAMQIATILEEQQGKLNDAFNYVQIATSAFRDIYGDESEHTIFAQFLALSISYSLRHDTVRKQCDQLFDQLVKRDKQFELQGSDNGGAQASSQPGQQRASAEFEERILKIKELCIATFILEMTRTLKGDEKQAVKSYCDKILFRAQQQKGMDIGGIDDDHLPNLAELHSRIDQMKISSLSGLKFDDYGRRVLHELYDEVSQNSFYGYSFSNFYQKVLDGVITHVREELKKQANQSGAGGTAQSSKPQKLGGTSAGGGGLEQNNLYDNWLVTDEPKEFFKRVIKCFEYINFYNLLIL